jgi:CRISPR/Cas system-associated exonuclease Cas4 (RecB family)
MTNARSKSEVLSKTCKSYLQELAIEEMYGIKKEFSSRYTDKGVEVERTSIDLIQDNCDFGFMYKNEEHFENDYLIGTPDVNTDNILLDVKSSYDATTFPWFEEEIPNKDYYFQLQGYMALCNKRKSVLAYCLVNTPYQIVEDEVRRAHWKEHLIDESEELRADVEARHNFDHIPAEKRIKTFEVRYDKEVIKAIYERIKECRKYYETLIQ